MEACVAAAVLLLVHLGTARSPAEGRIVHDAPLGRCCVANASSRIRNIKDDQANKQKQDPNGGTPTCLGLVLAVRSTPPLGAGALVLINPFYTGTSILAGVAGALAYVW